MVKISLALVALVSPMGVSAFGGMNSQPKQEISRRESLMKSVGVIGGIATSFPFIANAEPTEETPRIVTRMGGLLVSILILNDATVKDYFFGYQTQLLLTLS